MIGKTLGHYEILEPLGAGGMGEVYRAHDPNLKRDVAIKVLPEELASDPDRLARLEREAHSLAALNHPNVATIHGLEEADGVRFLVLELVEGDTLAERLRTGPLEVEEALGIAQQIAEGLEAAHGNGIVHRDLKPANIKVTPEGRVKVLDFGLAKPTEVEDDGAEGLTHSPTATVAATATGVLLGTAPYMSPEQVRGRAVDKRTDIWAFGCVLYEMLTGQQPFAGDDVTETIASIVKEEPDWSALPGTTPLTAQALLRRCLRKDPNRRLHDIADARIEIEEAVEEPVGLPVPAGETTLGRRVFPWTVATLGLAVGLVSTWWGLTRPDSSESAIVTSLSISLPPTEQLASRDDWAPLAISRDGSSIVYSALREGTRHLFLRSMNRQDAELLPGTQRATQPFFSPDGLWVAFFSEGQLKKISITGGAARSLSDAPQPMGGTWVDDTIIFSQFAKSGLFRVSAEGGQPQVLTTPDAENGETGHYWPHVLPGGRFLLYASATAEITTADDRQIVVLSLESLDQRVLVEGGNNPHYSATGHLVYTRAGTLRAVELDIAKLEVKEPSFEVLADVLTFRNVGAPQFALAQNGSLIFVAGGAEPFRQLVWVDRRGRATLAILEERDYYGLRLSPDGTRAALTVGGANHHLWILDLPRGGLTPLTDRWDQHNPRWSPDGDRIFFNDDRTGTLTVHSMSANGGEPTPLVEGRARAVSPDGTILAFDRADPSTGSDIWYMPLGDESQPQEFLATAYNESRAAFSPDGRWIAFQSNVSGAQEVYVMRFPDAVDRARISLGGGESARWSPNGRQLFYRSGGNFMAVTVGTDPTFSAELPTKLFELDPGYSGWGWDIAPNGERFLMIRDAEERTPPTRINVVLNWFEELKRLVPVER